MGRGTSTVQVTYQVPTGETNDPNSPWGNVLGELTKVAWNVSLDLSYLTFAGRTVEERDPGGGGPDYCYFDGGPAPRFVGITGGSAPVDPGNSYHDRSGWAESVVNAYQGAGRAPCDTHFSQDMYISKAPNESYARYITNAIAVGITNTTVWVSRAGVQREKVWP